MKRPIGIDLGTTYTLIATLEGGRPVILPNAEGQRLTPSVVSFRKNEEPVVGQPARELAAAYPTRSVLSIKRRMGSTSRVNAGGKVFTPQEVSSYILTKAKRDAERLLGEPIEQAVITVPAYFNERQRQATKEAATLAGLEVLRLLNEPTAAALAYGLEREDIHTVLVWDLGGGTFDVSILELGEGVFEVRAVSGDTRLGGDDFDERIAAYLVQQFGRRTGELFPGNPVAGHQLRKLAERAKKALSSSFTAPISIPTGGPNCSRQVEFDLTRAEVEDLTQDLVQRLVGPTRQALEDAGLSPNGIDRVLLVGGATRMPAVRNLARRLLGKEPYRFINPDEAVALGAAIHAGMALGTIQRAVLLDVLPLGLGVETQGGLMARLIPRNTPLPALASRVFTTATDLQPSMNLHVLQGERALAADNLSLGQVDLQGIPPAAMGEVRVEVTLEADVDGLVHLSAQELLTETEVKRTITVTKALDPLEMAGLAEEALRKAQDDLKARQRVEASIEAEGLVAAAQSILAEQEARSTGPGLEPLRTAIGRLHEALARGTAEELQRCCAELRKLLEAIAKAVAQEEPAGARLR